MKVNEFNTASTNSTLIEKETSSMFTVSVFINPITNTTPKNIIDIAKVYHIISSNPKFKGICEAIRGEENKEIVKELKRTKLPYFTPSGVFHSRSNNAIINHSGLICLDYDHITNVEELKDKLISDNTIPTVLLFNSPTNTGLKQIIRIPNNVDTHGDYFDALTKYIFTTHQVEVDKSGRDLARACFFSYDNQAYLNPNLESLEPLNEEFLSNWNNNQAINHTDINSFIENVGLEQSNEIKAKLNRLNKLVAKLESEQIDITVEYNDWFKIGMALCELGEAGREPYHRISALNEGYSFDETDDKFHSLLNDYNGKIGLGTLYLIASEHGVYIKEQNTDKEVNVDINTSAINTNHSNVQLLKSLPRKASERLLDAQKQQDVKPLLGAIWFTGELHVLFADCGVGKSIWATQIADAISKGNSVYHDLPNENEPKKVLFYDFELSDKQFQKRYTNEDGELYPFSENLYIDNIDFLELMEANKDGKIPADDLLINKIESDIIQLKADVLIIDNITYLKTESAQDVNVASQLIKKLIYLKRTYNLSILVLAHTPKINPNTPITINHLAGSKVLANLIDSASAIGKSSLDSNLRYIKQCKASRSHEELFGDNNVITIKKTHNDNFLKMDFVEYNYEVEHFKNLDKEEKEAKKMEEIALVKKLALEGLSTRKIMEQTGISKSKVALLLHK